MQQYFYHIVGTDSPRNKDRQEDADDKDPQVFFIHVDETVRIPGSRFGCCRNVLLPHNYAVQLWSSRRSTRRRLVLSVVRIIQRCVVAPFVREYSPHGPHEAPICHDRMSSSSSVRYKYIGTGVVGSKNNVFDINSPEFEL